MSLPFVAGMTKVRSSLLYPRDKIHRVSADILPVILGLLSVMGSDYLVCSCAYKTELQAVSEEHHELKRQAEEAEIRHQTEAKIDIADKEIQALWLSNGLALRGVRKGIAQFTRQLNAL